MDNFADELIKEKSLKQENLLSKTEARLIEMVKLKVREEYLRTGNTSISVYIDKEDQELIDFYMVDKEGMKNVIKQHMGDRFEIKLDYTFYIESVIIYVYFNDKEEEVVDNTLLSKFNKMKKETRETLEYNPELYWFLLPVGMIVSLLIYLVLTIS